MPPAAQTSPELSPLKRALLAIDEMQAKLDAAERKAREPIAIIGLGCRIPGGANTPEQFWKLLREGRNGVREIPADRWDTQAYYDPNPDTPGRIATKFGGFLDRVDGFEPPFFNISPREAATMDPQQRLLLEVSWEALEHAGQSPAKLGKTRTGVYFGMCSSDYGQRMLESGDPALLDMYYLSGIAHSVGSGRVSYVLGLQGPSVTVDTACSSSLVSVHLATQALRTGECRLALAGGVSVILSPELFVTMSRAHMLALDGKCKTFDAAADGFVRGEGCGVIVLKRLSDAIADHDRILGVIRGTAVNQDGPSSGLTAPNGPAQESVVRDALANAGLTPADISYIEAHGTGTSLGDPIEVQALGAVFGSGRDASTPLLLGSLKTNVGHLEAAAGVSGLIKLVLSLQHREIPRHLHFTTPSPHIPWERLPFKVTTEHQPWPARNGRRIGGVSSFGFSGTNAHVIVEEAPALAAAPASGPERERPVHVVTVSARTESALQKLAEGYAASFATAVDARDAGDLSYTANTGRAHLAHRLALTGRTAGELAQKLSQIAAGETPRGVARGHCEGTERPKIAFLFTGQGSQYAGMAQQLYATSPVFAQALDRCDTILTPRLGRSLLGVIRDDGGAGAINETRFTQPALFAVEYALSELWRSWGVQPTFVSGHSVGEYVAACLAGVFSLEDGLALIAERARLMQALPAGGRMAAVMAPAEEVRTALAPVVATVAIAALNGPRQTVISGAAADVERVLHQLQAAGVKTKELVVSHAFHSPLMDPMLDEFERAAAQVTFAPPRLRLISNLTGQVANAREITQPSYWRRHVREAVHFAPSIQTLAQLGCSLFLEIGPTPVLLALGRAAIDAPDAVWLPSLRSGRDDWEEILGSVSQLYARGVEIDWEGFDRDYARRKATLPAYPFEREHFMIPSRGPKAPAAPGARRDASSNLHPLLGRRIEAPSLPDIVFESTLGAASPAFAADHRVFDRIVFPATGYLEAVRAAVTEALGTGPWALDEIVIGEALAIRDDEIRRYQVVLADAANDTARFQVCSASPDSSGKTRTWRVHVTGIARRLSPADQRGRVDLAHARSDAPEVSRDELYRGYAERGLGFGPRFQGVHQVWRRGSTAIGQVAAPAALQPELAGFGLHPALLDACLQVVGAALPDSDTTSLFMPLGLESFRIFRDLPARAWSIATLDDAVAAGSAETIRANVRITDENGEVIAELSGIAFKRARREALERALREPPPDWCYEINWKPAANPSVAAGVPPPVLPDPATLAPVLVHQLHEFATSSGLSRFEKLRPRLDGLCSAYIAHALQSLGLRASVGASFAVPALAEALAIKPEHHRLFGRFIEILAEDGFAELRGAEGRWMRPLPALDLAGEHGDLSAAYPEFDAALIMTGRCGPKLGEAITGRADPLELLFPSSDLTTAEKLYQHSPSARTYNPLIRDAVRAAVAALPAGRPLRILEVGAGTGSTTAHVLPVLPGERTQYVFSDMSPLFLARAEAKFAGSPFVRFQIFDLERDALAQGFSPGSFDLIIASNCIHATAELRPTLASVRNLLAPGGWLLLLEVTRPQRWFDLTFGLTDGWWRFRDADLRTNYPLISRAQWRSLLTTAGFDALSIVPSTHESAAETEDTALIIARADPARSRRWLLLADRDGTADALAARLRDSGDSCEIVPPAPEQAEAPSPGSVDALIQRATADAATAVTDVVDLRALSAPRLDAVDARAIAAIEQVHCGAALHLAQALVRHAGSSAPHLWLCTRGAQAVAPLEADLAPAAATLWGLGRVIALEAPELRCTRVDLDPAADPTEAAALADILRARESEEELALRGGARMVPRLEKLDTASGTTGGDGVVGWAGKPYQLAFDQRGSIDNVKITPARRRPPGPGEIEIRVHAAALNFRDVMNVLGLYPGDPGPMGAECAGEVVAVGEGVSEFAVGDAVLAATGGSFAAFVTTRAEYAARKPAPLGFAQAVTFPVAFMTAHFTLNHLARLRAGDRVLIHAAAGGVGLAAVALAQRAGAEIFATAGSPEKRALLRSLGVAHTLDSRSLDFADEVLRLTHGRGVDVVLNSLADRFVDRSFDVIAPHGRFLEIGKRGIWEPARVQALNKNIEYHIVDWGVDARENPALIGRMLRELVTLLEQGELAPLPHRVFPLRDAVHAFRLMAQGRHTGKIVLSHEEILRAERLQSARPIRSDGTYLITGGLRGIGLLTAQGLVDCGARHLVLTGRRPPDENTVQTLETWKARGAAIRTAAVDAADVSGMTALFKDVCNEMPPLRGVIHSAGTLEDGVLLQQDWQRFAKVFAPKVTGSLLLHQLTRDAELDFFVLYSTAASVVGSAGQSNHAAANAFLDTLAAARRAAGLPGLSINWGAWSGSGAAVDRGVTSRAVEAGYGIIDPAGGLRVLENLLHHPRAQVAVLPADWPTFLRKHARGRPIPAFFSSVARAAASSSGTTVSPGDTSRSSTTTKAAPEATAITLVHRLAKVAPNQRRPLVVAQIREDAARVLGLSAAAALPNNKPLNELGLDSLMAVEMRNALGKAVGRTLPATLLFDYPTIDALTNHLCKSVLALDEGTSASAARPSSAPPARSASPDDVLSQIENLDDSEIERLLKSQVPDRP